MDFNFVSGAQAAHKSKISAVFAGTCAAVKKGLSHIAFLLKKAANAVYQGVAHAATAVVSYAKRNPEVVIAVAVVVAGIIIILIMPQLLGVAGFGSMGPVAGSMAAGVQAGIGNVAAGGLFATLQSAAMGGYGVAVVAAAVGAAAVAVGGAVIAWFTRARGSTQGKGE